MQYLLLIYCIVVYLFKLTSSKPQAVTYVWNRVGQPSTKRSAIALSLSFNSSSTALVQVSFGPNKSPVALVHSRFVFEGGKVLP